MPQAAAAPARSTPGRPVIIRSLIRYAVYAVVVASILFLVSGRADWTRAWAYIALTLGVQVVVGLALQRKNPALLVERSRMQPGTKPWDKVIAPLIAIVGAVAIWVVAALDMRNHWPPQIGTALSVAALIVCTLGCVLTAWAMVTNAFFSATVRIQTDRNHVVVDSGPYRYVRHPGYTGALLFTMASPIALGSSWTLIPAAITSAILVLRTALEDATLKRELDGYAAFATRVPFRLVPWVW
jgi:protein-S-isoprenylcysteine O-methyltransferase Ste14